MVDVLLALDDVDAVALLVGRLAADVVVGGGFGRSRVEALGGLRGNVDGFLGGIEPLSGGFCRLLIRDFSGDLGPSAEGGFEDGVDARADILTIGAVVYARRAEG